MVKNMASVFARLSRHVHQHWPFMAAIALLLIVYAPTLTTAFGVHNDYSLLFKANPTWFGFIESAHFFVIGRPVGAIAMNIIFNTLKDVETFTIWRWVAFAFLVWFLAVAVWQFLRRTFGLERFWAAVAVVLTGITPVVSLFILWICMIPPGIPNALIAVGAYLCLERARAENGWLKTDRRSLHWALAAFSLFVFSLYYYPPTTLIVFIFTFAYVLFASSEKWAMVRCRALTDMAFWGAALVFFRITERYVVTPILTRHETYRATQTYYDMGFMHGIDGKLAVIAETLNVSIAGPWHFAASSWGWILPCLVLALLAAAAFFLPKPVVPAGRTLEYAERAVWVVVLWVAANFSVILPKGVTELLGYRLVMVSSVMGVLFCVAVLRWASQRERCGRWARVVAVVLVAASLMATSSAFSRVLLNYTRELHFLRGSLAAADLHQKTQFAFIKLPPKVSLIPDSVPYEYSMMITDSQHFIPFVTRALAKIGRPAGSAQYYLLTPDYRGRVVDHPQVFVFDPQSLRYWDEGK